MRPGPTPGRPRRPDARDVPAELLEFVALFNRGEYWESHEVLEAPWRRNRSGFFKGLILYASAFVHLRRGNAHGLGAQLRKARRELRPYRPAHLGLDVDDIRAHAAKILDALERGPDTIPDRPLERPLRLDASLLRGDEPELDG